MLPFSSFRGQLDLDESILGAIKSYASKVVSFLMRKLKSIKWGQKQIIKIPLMDMNHLRELHVTSANPRNLSSDINEPCTRFYVLHKLASNGFKVKEGSIDAAKAQYIANRRAWISALKEPKHAGKKAESNERIKIAVDMSDKMSDHIVEAVMQNPDSKLMMYDAIDSSKGGHNDTADVTLMAKKFSEDEMHHLVGLSLKAMVSGGEVKLGRFAHQHGSIQWGCFHVLDYIITGNYTPSKQMFDNLPKLLNKYKSKLSQPEVVKGIPALQKDGQDLMNEIWGGGEGWIKVKKEMMTLKPHLFKNGLDWADNAGAPDRLGLRLAFHMDVPGPTKAKTGFLVGVYNRVCTDMLEGSKDEITFDSIKRLLDGIEIGDEHTLIYGAISRVINEGKGKPKGRGFDVFTTHSTDFKKLVDGSLTDLSLEVENDNTTGTFVVKHAGKEIFSVGYIVWGNATIQFTLRDRNLQTFNNFGYKFEDPEKLRKAEKLPS